MIPVLLGRTYYYFFNLGKVGATGENTMHWSVHINGDPNLTLETDQIERQFLIKWKGWSHINNTWESESSLGRFH